jgi:hypothetical protein
MFCVGMLYIGAGVLLNPRNTATEALLSMGSVPVDCPQCPLCRVSNLDPDTDSNGSEDPDPDWQAGIGKSSVFVHISGRSDFNINLKKMFQILLP